MRDEREFKLKIESKSRFRKRLREGFGSSIGSTDEQGGA